MNETPQSGYSKPTGAVTMAMSPHQEKLNSMVLGDGGFEAMMKERSKVSSSIIIMINQCVYNKLTLYLMNHYFRKKTSSLSTYAIYFLNIKF